MLSEELILEALIYPVFLLGKTAKEVQDGARKLSQPFQFGTFTNSVNDGQIQALENQVHQVEGASNIKIKKNVISFEYKKYPVTLTILDSKSFGKKYDLTPIRQAYAGVFYQIPNPFAQYRKEFGI